MSNSVKRPRVAKRAPAPAFKQDAASLYTRGGERKYLTRAERQRVPEVIARQETDARLLALVMAWTGCRPSEALALTAQAFQVEAGLVAIVTLKRRRLSVREVPIPRELMAALDLRFSLGAAANGKDDTPVRLWPCCRGTVWRQMKIVMAEAGVSGRAACPRGLRHGFAVGTLQSGVPLTLAQKWLGHANLKTTAIYADVSGAEEEAFAADYWRWSKAA